MFGGGCKHAWISNLQNIKKHTNLYCARGVSYLNLGGLYPPSVQISLVPVLPFHGETVVKLSFVFKHKKCQITQ